MYNLNFDIWKFGHPQCANSANGALSEFNISGNALTEVEAPSSSNGWAGVYSMEGVIALADVLKK